MTNLFTYEPGALRLTSAYADRYTELNALASSSLQTAADSPAVNGGTETGAEDARERADAFGDRKAFKNVLYESLAGRYSASELASGAAAGLIRYGGEPDGARETGKIGVKSPDVRANRAENYEKRGEGYARRKEAAVGNNRGVSGNRARGGLSHGKNGAVETVNNAADVMYTEVNAEADRKLYPVCGNFSKDIKQAAGSDGAAGDASAQTRESGVPRDYSAEVYSTGIDMAPGYRAVADIAEFNTILTETGGEPETANAAVYRTADITDAGDGSGRTDDGEADAGDTLDATVTRTAAPKDEKLSETDGDTVKTAVTVTDFEDMLTGAVGEKTRVSIVDNRKQQYMKIVREENGEPVPETAPAENRAYNRAEYAALDADTGARDKITRIEETGAITERPPNAALLGDGDGDAGSAGDTAGRVSQTGVTDITAQNAAGTQNGSGAFSGSQQESGGSEDATQNAATAISGTTGEETAAGGAVYQQGSAAGSGGQGLSVRETVRTAGEIAPEFFDTVAREAKLVLNGDKHELIMQLKPESLGKVAMQVITENGVVNTRFIVENEQARVNLESNLAQLKEALVLQGLNVQGCMVEVRQDGGREAVFGETGDGGKRVRKTGAREGGTTRTAPLDAVKRAFLRNLYFDGQSSVHFMA